MVLAGNKKHIALAAVSLAVCAAANGAVQLGIDVLEQSDYAILRGKRVGLITNQTGVDSDGNRTRLLLRQHCTLVTLYTPEHGLDGREPAGKYVKSRRDRLTGLVAFSLYGPTRKPTRSMLSGVDVLVFDLQDIGCRGYTYISTMGKCMEAAAENNLEFVVLDRPNPLGGLRVEGPSVEPRWISFVSQFPIPYVHGMTVGELAKMVNAKGWINGQCKLTVVPMRGWSRDRTWSQTGLRWIATSPNIPHATSPLYYVATGIAGELSGLDTGVGGATPFQIMMATWTNAESFTRYLQSLDMPGVELRAFQKGRYRGCALSIEPNAPANLTALGIYMLAELNRTSGSTLFRRTPAGKLDIFYKIYGSASIRRQLERGVSPAGIVASWRSNVASFRSERAPYLIY
jgi:uncharacterized protein YbbC (DUF1343 family)